MNCPPPHMKKAAELAMVAALPEILHGTRPGRVRGACKKAAKTAIKELGNLPQLSETEKEQICRFIEEFDRATHWRERPRHIVTIVSFLCEMFEGRHPEIMKHFVKIENHFGRIGKSPEPSAWAGKLANEKWNQAMAKCLCRGNS